MKILQYNVLNGCRETSRFIKFSQWIARQDYDIIGFNEMNDWTKEELQQEAEKWGYSYSYLLEMTSSLHFIGIIAKFPINLIYSTEEPPFHHGLLHVKIKNIHFLVTHLSPFESEQRETETSRIGEYVISISEPVVVMGDLNSLSPLDQNYYKQSGIDKYFASSPKQSRAHLRNGVINYQPMNILLNAGLYDVGFKEYCDYSCPTPLVHDAPQEVGRRIDYFLVNSTLKRNNPVAEVIRNDEVEVLSDHYPIKCEWND